MSKKERLSTIKKLVTTHKIVSQEDLVSLLASCGFDVTQATLSRDMKELRIIKLHDSDGSYVYRLSPDLALVPGGNTLQQRVGFKSIQFSNHLAVIKTAPSYAGSIALDIDTHIGREVIGTIAGDDTILLIPRESISDNDLLDALQTIIPNVKENIIR